MVAEMPRIMQAKQEQTCSDSDDERMLSGADYQRGFARLSNDCCDEPGPMMFHQDVTVDGERGFLQRGNLLDRF
jgi:hypothetical protein